MSHKRPMPDNFPELAKSNSSEKLQDIFSASAPVVRRWRHECGVMVTRKGGFVAEPAPAEFAEYGQTHTNMECQQYFGKHYDTISRWEREVGIALPKGQSSGGKREMPEDFADLYPHMTINALIKHYRTSDKAISRWAKEAGLSRPQLVVDRAPRKPNPAAQRLYQPASQRLKIGANLNRDMSLAARAVDECLKKLGPMWRCLQTGRPDVAGKFWRRGSAVLTDAEVVERARAKGWDPDAWKRVPARLSGAAA